MDANVLSLFNQPLATVNDSSADPLGAFVALLPNIDFDSLIADITDSVNDAIADVDQVVDSTTSLVVETLTNLGVDIETVDVSDVVEDIVNFIAELPEDATIADVLSDVVDFFEVMLPSLSDDELLGLLIDVSDLINEIAPDLSQLSITPFLEQGVDFVEDLIDSTGTITIDGPNLSGELTQDGILRSFTIEFSDDAFDDLLEDASDFLAGITGSASLSDGQFTGDVTIDGNDYTLSLDITEALTDSLTSLFTSAEVTLPFANGVLNVDIDTALGDFVGTIDFAGGDLDLDLTTPFGALDTSIEFPEDAQFELPGDMLAGVDAELDWSAGVVRIPIPSTLLALPLEAFSGELSLSEGSGAFTAGVDGLPIGDFSTTFEVGPLASQLASALTEDLRGELTIDAGEIAGNIVSDFGEFEVAAAFDDLILQASSIIDSTTGALTLQDGIASINLDTSLGQLSGAIALSAVEDVLTNASSLLA
ncbi:hypothetical protein D0962_04035 [Leptolyngbyaceae cyanobacterium CCMR0082]|uniref:Uncharacterized protein n=1 Tax=Adonisia turfae CCMR0082 TaxID=2304604 RepID=A0A6M0S1Z5_9CYAN|nr:hypothetical protein [Adonisia turfae]NEZ61952.1 hypothetical protein [Adonisia turfae CCMR0082]